MRILFFSRQTALAWTLVCALATMLSAHANAVNLIVNPDFNRTYAAWAVADPKLANGRPEQTLLPGFEGDAFMPYGWNVSPAKDKQGLVSLSDENGAKSLRIRAKEGERLLLQQTLLEVVPGASYVCGIKVNGTGNVKLHISASNPGPSEELVQTNITASQEWQNIESKVKIGPHRHFAVYQIEIAGPADLMFRDAQFSAISNATETDKLLAVKPSADADTIFYEGFDGKDSIIPEGPAAKLTAENGGRFGRGLAISDIEGGSRTPLKFGDLPEKGTIEFWFKPEEFKNNTCPLAITTSTPGLSATRLLFKFGLFATSISFGFQKAMWEADYASSSPARVNNGWGPWKAGTWHHFAGSWNNEIMRFYVDGVLQGVCYGKGTEMPRGKVLDLVLAANGVIDEIRISKTFRYGPIIPEGAKAVPFNQPAPAETNAAVESFKDPAETELDKQRLKLISPVPDAGAGYVFGIDQIKPGWEGMPGLEVRPNYFGKGVNGMKFGSLDEVGRVAYFRLENIERGEYYIGLWTDCEDYIATGARTEFDTRSLKASAYLNGWPVRFSTTSDPVQVVPGTWLAELQSAKAVTLQSGDEIAFCTPYWPQTFLRLALYKKAPKRGHGIASQTFGALEYMPQRLRLVIRPEIIGTMEDGTAQKANISIFNPLPYAADIEVQWKLADYFGAPVQEKTERMKIPSHKSSTIANSFTASEDAKAYQLDVRTKPAPGFKLPFPRPLELLDLNDYTRFEFLPNQPGPLNVWNHIRKDLVNDKTGDRMLLALDCNDWEWAYLDGRRVPETPPADLKFAKCKLQTTVGEWTALPPDKFGKWFRKKFTLPNWMRGQNYIVDTGVGFAEGTVFLNGQRLGHGITGRFGLPTSMPFPTDVTSAIKVDGENELLICVRDAIALVSPDFVDKFDFSTDATRRAADENLLFNVPVMSHVAALASVSLRTAPSVRVRQILVVPDVEKKQLRILARIENLSKETSKLKLRSEVFQNGERANTSIPEQEVTVPAGEIKQIAFDTPAGDLIPYAMKNPVLAKLKTSLVDKDGRILDSFDERFGYRSLKVKGTDFSLNGKPARLIGASFRRLHDMFEGEDSIDVSRGANECGNPDLTVKMYDEIGVLFYCQQPAIIWSQSWKKLNNPVFWENARKQAIERVWEAGSHPSAIGWDISNESFHYAAYSTGKEGQLKHGELIASIAEAIRKEVWPDYWFFADGDENLGGLLDFCSFHYLNHGYWHRGNQTMGVDISESPGGVSHYPPDGFYVNGASRIPVKGTILNWWKYGSTACGDTETFDFEGDANGPAIGKYVGDNATVSTACQFYSPRGMAWAKMAMGGYRDMEAALTSGMYWQGILGVFAQDVAFDMPEQAVRYFSGAKFDKRLNIFDDEFLPGRLAFKWKLLDPRGKTVRKGQISAESDTAFIKRDRITFDLPKVDDRTRYTLTLELRKDGIRRSYEERNLEVWPAIITAVPGKKENVSVPISVFDPSGKVVPILDKLGVAAKTIKGLDQDSLAGAARLVIGPDSLNKEMADWKSPLQEFVGRGGRVLVLRQKDASLLPFRMNIEKRGYSSIGFVRVKEHPVLAGLEDLDFQMWNPNHLIARGMYLKPDKGDTLTLVDAGQDDKMSWSVLLEIYMGKGSIVATQLPLTECLDTEPMSGEMFKRIIAYMSKPVFRSAESRLAILGNSTEAVNQQLKNIRADYATVSSLDNKWPVTLLDMNAVKEVPEAASLRSYAENGGTLILHRIRPEHQAWLENVTGEKVNIAVQPYQGWADRQMLDRRDGLAKGMNNMDLYWRSLVPGNAYNCTLQVSSGVQLGKERGQALYLVKVEGIKDYLFPGGLAEVPIGKGQIVIDQLKWELSDKDMLCGSPARYISTLLGNLGIHQKDAQPKPVLPAGVKYETVDIAPFANLALTDEKVGDGTGWCDWGPEADLKDLPTGKVNDFGIPFDVPKGAKNAICLRVNPVWLKSLSTFPDTVCIPVNKSNVAGLIFLHTGGWANGTECFGRREIEYSDGTKEVMQLDGSNMADWNYGRDDFLDEEGTTTVVAWKGANEQYPTTRVYMTTWFNPHPEKEIRQVTITNAGIDEKKRSFIPHLGLTAAILPSAQNLAAKKYISANAIRDSVKSNALLKEAATMIDAGKDKEAVVKLEEALKADDANTGAWMALGALRAKTASIPEFKELFGRWTKAEPDNYQAYNALGRFLEEKKLDAEAFAAYKKSLEIEWNQPLIGQASERLDKKLKPGEK